MNIEQALGRANLLVCRSSNIPRRPGKPAGLPYQFAIRFL
jgi:hypothetical protein